MDLPTATRRLGLHARFADDDVGGLAALAADLVAALDEVSARALLRHAYWRMPEVPTAALEQAVGGAGALHAAVGPGPVVGGCASCARPVRARTPAEADADLVGPCRRCQAAVRTAAA